MRPTILIAFFLSGLSSLSAGLPTASNTSENLARVIAEHLDQYRGQTVSIQIISRDTSLELVEGPASSRYHLGTYFKAGYLLILSQAWFSAQMEAREEGFLDQKVLFSTTLRQLLSHHSGFPRYPWYMELCNEEALHSFVRQYVAPEKPSFQMSFTDISLTENWLRNQFEHYPERVFESWGIYPMNVVDDSSILADSKVIRQSQPIECWSFCMTCSSPGLYLTVQDAGRLVSNILENQESWELLMQPKAKTPLPHLRMALGFQIAENIKTLPLAMLASSDHGNAAFIGISPHTDTGIVILGDTDEPVDNLGLRLMALFHRDILNFKP